MKHIDLILLVRAVANESKLRGFPNTANAMREVIEGLIVYLHKRQ